MKRLVVALIVGLSVGYNWGYGEGTGGKASVMTRTLERFGTGKVKAAQDAHNKKVDEAARP
jgi:hypothetical protein